MRSLAAFCALLVCAHASDTALVTGATGRTGSLIYKALKKQGVGEVRAFVHNATKAKERLGCKACDESEGIYIGDVNDPVSLAKAMDGVNMLADAVGVFGTETVDVVKKVEWEGVKAQVAALLKGGVVGKRVMMISSMGTEEPPEPKSNDVLFYKLNAEAFLENSGVSYAIIKPCGLAESPAGQRELMVGHDGVEPWFGEGFYMIPREDVANIAAVALTQAPVHGMKFDLCAKLPGSGPPKAPKELLKDALLPWQKEDLLRSQ